MAWDIELNVRASAGRVFDVITAWHRNPELLSLASVHAYHVSQADARNEYFWLSVRDLPFMNTYCYGRRLFRRPDLVVNMFTYRFFRNRRLEQPANLEADLHREWERFYYQTMRIETLEEGWSRLLVIEPGHGRLAPEQRRSLELFYERLKQIAEAGLVLRGGIDFAAAGVSPAAGATQAEGISAGLPSSGQQDDGFAPVKGAPPHLDDYDPYAILGVARDAPLQEVKQAYRAMAMRWHPDRMGDRAAMKEYAHNQFIEVTAAYHTILREREK